ncbi:MAG TPA: hypothetical protein VG010_02430 [Solirubrobacteraceae bacterium]|jgi:hypothetical protein|nr:hypothetical protein [Solirubrobacteraceae bacterium]
MTERPLAVLEAFGDELRRLGEPPTSRFGQTRRTLLIAVVLTLLLAGVATAAILIARGSPLPPPNATDLQASGVPLPASVRLAGLDAPDPAPSELPWDIRLSQTRAGETCTAVGQVLGGQFGIVGLDHVFRALPLGGVDACGVDAHNGPVLAGARVFVGTSVGDPRTVVNGVAGPGVRSVTVYGPDGARPLRLGPQGSFITVYRGYVEEVRPRVVVVTRDGRSHAIRFAQTSAFEVADPAGGSPWEVSASADLEPHGKADESCAQASQELGRSNPSRVDASLTPLVCGPLGHEPLFVVIRRFVPGSGERTGFPWGNNAPRTLIYGAAAPRVESLMLTGAGPARSLPVDRHGGAFLAVLDGHVDPRSVALTAHLQNGQTLTYTRSTNLFDYQSNRPLHEQPVPAYRAPLPMSQAMPAEPDLPLSSTVRTTLRAKDPAGGPTWALRSWQGVPNPRANFGTGDHPARFICFQFGVLEHDRLFEPRPGSTSVPLSVGQEYGGSGGCNTPGDLARFPPFAEPVSYVDDPYAYAPRPVRTVVSGVLALDATHPKLLGAGAPRPLALDANHAFLAVLPGRYWDAPLRIAVAIHGRTMLGSTVPSFPGPPAPSTPQARAPDPDGGAPWGFAASSNGSSAVGRILEGRLAGISELDGTLRHGPEAWNGGGEARLRQKPPPVRFDSQGGAESLPGQVPAALPRPKVQRRTLPGRTVITGVANPDVVSVTLVTPRDVRTLRPSGPQHALIVVYDGQFFQGLITANVLLHDGRTVTEQVPNGPGGVVASAPQRPSLAQRLRSDQATLAGMRRQVDAAERSSARQRATRLRRQPPLSQLVQGLRDIALIVEVEKARIGYLNAHPGVLPTE